MPRGPDEEKRPADAIGCAVMVAEIATGEQEDTSYVSKNRRKSAVEGAKARRESVDAERRSEIATKAAEARWKVERKMTDMTFDQRFQRAFDGGLADIKFFVRRDGSVTPDALMSDALAFQEAIDFGNVKEVNGVD